MKDSTSGNKLCVVLTYPLSLSIWDKQGLIDREVKPYFALRDRGWDITFFSYGHREEEQLFFKNEKGIRVVTPWRSPPQGIVKKAILSMVLGIKWIPFFQKFDVVKTNQMIGAWIPVLSTFGHKNNLLVRCGYEWFRTLVRQKRYFAALLAWPLSWLVYLRAKRIIITSVADQKFVQKFFPGTSGKISVIPNYIDVERFTLNANGTAPDEDVLFVGRAHPEKRLNLLLKASVLKGFSVHVVGAGHERSQQKAREMGANVKFLGKVPNGNLPELMTRYKVFALPSKYEGNPKALLEAMACGKAVVGACVTGVQEIITTGKTGILCPPHPELFAEAIAQLLNNSQLREELGRQASSYIKDNNSLQACLEKEEAVYLSI